MSRLESEEEGMTPGWTRRKREHAPVGQNHGRCTQWDKEKEGLRPGTECARRDEEGRGVRKKGEINNLTSKNKYG